MLREQLLRVSSPLLNLVKREEVRELWKVLFVLCYKVVERKHTFKLLRICGQGLILLLALEGVSQEVNVEVGGLEVSDVLSEPRKQLEAFCFLFKGQLFASEVFLRKEGWEKVFVVAVENLSAIVLAALELLHKLP